MYEISNFPGISPEILQRANESIYDYHKGRRALDFAFIESVFIAQARLELERLKQKHPNKAVHWPEKHPVIGFIPMEIL